MSRTDDLRNQGARDRTGGGGPFVKWPKDARHVWVEGTVTDLWEGEYGLAATIRVGDVNGVEAGGGDGPTRPVEIGDEVNVGLNYASLKDSVQESDIGGEFHFAFEGWGETRGGDKFRRFAVLEISPPPRREPERETAPSGGGPVSAPDDDLPFLPIPHD